MTDMPVSLLEWKKMEKNTLRGFAKIRLGRSLVIRDVSLHVSNGKRWASLPSKPQLDQDGNPRRDERGKILYTPMIEWGDRDAADRFSNSVIAAVEREYPGQTGA